MSEQLTLTAEETIDARFTEFHAANPHIYTTIIAYAHRARGAGVQSWGISPIIEAIRWDHAISTNGIVFKVNNDFRSRYARLVMEQEPGLEGFFETRKLRAA